jgi:TPR repeat protein
MLITLLLLACAPKPAEPTGPATAVPTARRCLDGADAAACLELAERYRQGTDVAPDLTAAREYYDHACALGVAGACHEMAGMLERGEGGDADLPSALALYDNVCQGDTSDVGLHACHNAGIARLMTDAPLGVEQLRASCERGLAESCSALALAYLEGKHVEADHAVALALALRTCELGGAAACNVAADLVDAGVAADDGPEASALRARACEQGYAAACTP